MDLVNLKMTRRETEEPYGGSVEENDRYPYGTVVTLDGDVVGKLGASGLEAGEEVSVEAVAVVKTVNVRNIDDKENSVSITLQLTDMSLSEPRKATSLATRLYPIHKS